MAEPNLVSQLGNPDALFWRLAYPAQFSEPALHGHHVHWLCVLAFVVAILASWVLLTVMQRYQSATGRARRQWLVVGSIVMGTGIWAMHFTSMLAFSLPIPVAYDPLITMFSGFPAVFASAGFLAFYREYGLTQWRMAVISLIMAVGIGTMHYLGMEAVIVTADMYYEPVLFGLSILAAVALAYAAVFTQARLRRANGLTPLQAKVIGSLSLGLAVTLMHFTAMSATFFQPNAETVLYQNTGAPFMLVFEVIAITLLLLGLATVVSMVDRRMSDISSRLQMSEKRFEGLAESTQTAIFTFNEQRVTYANPALSKMLGKSVAEIYRSPLDQVFDKEVKAQAKVLLNGSSPVHQDYHRELHVAGKDGEDKWLLCSFTVQQLESEAVVLASAFDVTEQKIAESKMRELAYHDHLTGLNNRTVFMDRLQHTLARKHRYHDDVVSCVMILDLDGFKAVNDSYGHLAGDRLLIAVAERLKKLARESDTLSRFGGDEFVLLLEEIEHSIQIDRIAERFLEILSEPLELDGHNVEVACSIGLVELNENYHSPDDVLHDADLALYRAKEVGASWTVFDENLDAEAKRKRTLLPELKQAIDSQSLELYFQPICDSDSGLTLGLEALARWQRDNGEWVGPGEFIALAEESGLVHNIGLWALHVAAGTAEQLNRVHKRTIYVSINIEADTLNDSRFIPTVREVFANHDLRPGQLKIELTERGLIKDTSSVIAKMQE
ncbi:MAG: diguanylate cyclase domain-containing protein, partial [Pseudomonadales bacterium]